MCGICGIISPHRKVEVSVLERMRDVLVHRGPDDAGIYVSDDKTAGLGHRRLSIIDLSTAGRQPMTNENGTIWVTYNGEIYNFMELRDELEKKGHRFSSRTDTEVILHLYEEYGEEFVRHLDGQFAFGLWDDREKKLILARDRFGKKPLYYYHKGEILVFASEIKSILQYPYIEKQINLDSLYDYLTFQYVPYPETIFQDIRKLPPSSMMVFMKGIAKIRRYYKIGFIPEGPFREDGYYEERVYESLKEAVKKRLISDVPLGVFLSGGIDSSTIVALMTEQAGERIKTFSVGFKEKEYSETDYATEVARSLDTDHEEIILEPASAMDLIPELARQFDEPLADQAAVPTYLMSRIAKGKVTVCLSGEGGDEIFGGYPRYNIAIRNSELADALSIGNSKIKREIMEALIPDTSQYVKSLCSFDDKEKTLVIRKDIYEEVIKRRNGSYPHIERVAKDCTGLDYLTALQYTDIYTYLTDNLMVKIDRASMLASLEIRAPMLDHMLVETALNMPVSLKVRAGIQKYILRKLMKDKLPPRIIWRGKMGFSLPLPKWFKGDLNDYARDLLLGWRPGEAQFFNKTYVKSLLEKEWYESFSMALKVWTLLIFEEWRRQYNV